MTIFQICELFDFPPPPTLMQLASLMERRERFEAILHKKYERLQKYALREDSSQTLIDDTNEEILMINEMINHTVNLYEEQKEETEREHMYQLSLSVFGAPLDLTGLTPYQRRKKLQAEIDRVKIETDFDGLCKKYNL